MTAAHDNGLDYLIVGGLPTPNGPLHLGHIGGPFLRADALARFLNADGKTAACGSASDVWNHHNLLVAEQLGLQPASVIDYYHTMAGGDLSSLEMPQVAYTNPYVGTVGASYALHSDDLIRMLSAAKLTRIHKEHLPYDDVAESFAFGPWLVGRCPYCSGDVAGPSCEGCARWFLPEAIVDPRSRDGRKLETRPFDNVSAVLPAGFDGSDLAERFPRGARSLLSDYQTLSGGWLRLREPLLWGVPWRSGARTPAVHNNYGTGLYAISRVIGEQVALTTALEHPLFTADSQTKTVLSGGMEFVLPTAFLMSLENVVPNFRAYDYLMLSTFLTLEGAKFSTSRRHAIWARHYWENDHPVDELRWYLASIADRGADFSALEFAARVESDLVGQVESTAARAATLHGERSGAPTGVVSPALVELSRVFFAEQRDAFALPDIDLSRAAELLPEWAGATAEHLDSPADGALWLRTAAVLASPLMPTWASAAWAAAGEPGAPSRQCLAASMSEPAPLRPIRVPDALAITGLIGAPAPAPLNHSVSVEEVPTC